VQFQRNSSTSAIPFHARIPKMQGASTLSIKSCVTQFLPPENSELRLTHHENKYIRIDGQKSPRRHIPVLDSGLFWKLRDRNFVGYIMTWFFVLEMLSRHETDNFLDEEIQLLKVTLNLLYFPCLFIF
jgi:hypothetical protein